MALPTDPTQVRADLRTAYHVNDGPTTMYAVDANSAAARHPDEWSLTPWDPDRANEARRRLRERQVAEAQAEGRQVPPERVEPEMTDEERAEFDEWKARRDKAKEVLDAAAKEKAEQDAKADEIAAAQAAINAPPPQPDPNRRRPLTGAAKANADRKAAADKAAADKAEADRKNQGAIPGPAGPVSPAPVATQDPNAKPPGT